MIPPRVLVAIEEYADAIELAARRPTSESMLGQVIARDRLEKVINADTYPRGKDVVGARTVCMACSGTGKRPLTRTTARTYAVITDEWQTTTEIANQLRNGKRPALCNRLANMERDAFIESALLADIWSDIAPPELAPPNRGHVIKVWRRRKA